MKKRFIILCEESQSLTKELRALGIEAYSNDILPCSGGRPEWHIQGDCFAVLEHHKKWPYEFHKKISFPPCTDLTLSGAKHFEKKRLNGTQEKSIRFFFEIWKISDCVENPMGIMNGGGVYQKTFSKITRRNVGR